MDNHNIWEGIYSEFPETELSRIWDSDRWVTSVFKSFSSRAAADGDSGAGSVTLNLVHEYPLPPVAALLASKKDSSPLRILDFGGGGGGTFMACIHSLPDADAVEFHIVEGRKVCERGRQLYRPYRNIFFHESLPCDGKSFDIVHIAAALHYVRDWRGLLKELLSKYRPGMLMLNALNAGEIKTFVSFQHYYGERIPVWFWNIDDVLEFLKSLNCRLIYKSLLEFSFLGKFQPLPMQNFPLDHRLDRKCNLIFITDHQKQE